MSADGLSPASEILKGAFADCGVRGCDDGCAAGTAKSDTDVERLSCELAFGSGVGAADMAGDGRPEMGGVEAAGESLMMTLKVSPPPGLPEAEGRREILNLKEESDMTLRGDMLSLLRYVRTDRWTATRRMCIPGGCFGRKRERRAMSLGCLVFVFVFCG